MVDIELKDAWLGHPKGSKISIEENQAKSMIARGVAKINQHWQPSAKAIEQEKDRLLALKAKEEQEKSVEAPKEEKIEITSKMQRRDKDKIIKNVENK